MQYKNIRLLIHSADPKSRLVGIIVFAHVVRPHLFSKSSKTKQCSLLARMWVWPSGSLMTPVLFHIRIDNSFFMFRCLFVLQHSFKRILPKSSVSMCLFLLWEKSMIKKAERRATFAVSSSSTVKQPLQQSLERKKKHFKCWTHGLHWSDWLTIL